MQNDQRTQWDGHNPLASEVDLEDFCGLAQRT